MAKSNSNTYSFMRSYRCFRSTAEELFSWGREDKTFRAPLSCFLLTFYTIWLFLEGVAKVVPSPGSIFESPFMWTIRTCIPSCRKSRIIGVWVSIIQ